MTIKLARAREEAQNAASAAVEAERAALAVILARLTSGVISLEPDLSVRVANQAAGQILGVDFDQAAGQPLAELAATPSVARAVAGGRTSSTCRPASTNGASSSTLRGDSSRRELVCACTALPGDATAAGGLVLVFDEITAAAAGAARGRMGRSGAPAGPRDQQSADADPAFGRAPAAQAARGLAPAQAELLDRATHTIVQQVEAMKQMVAAFSEYARAPRDAVRGVRSERR